VLLEKGADPNHICQDKTAADLGFENDKMECVTLLRPLTTKGIFTGEKKAHLAKNIEPEVVNVEEANKIKDEGNALFKEGKKEEALALYEKAISFNKRLPSAAPIYTNKATCLILLGKYQDALEAAQIAKELDPNWSKAYYREAQAFEGLKEYGDAAASYFEALKLDPSNTDAKQKFDNVMEIGKKYYQRQKKN
jgi:tetratricopeptide (TPR) repeat protein